MNKFLKAVSILITTFLIFSCSQKKILETMQRETSSASTKYSLTDSKDVIQLTFHGNNSQPSFSPDGSKIVYISKNRYRHSNAQVYEYSLSMKEENRVIFQDGESSSPIYSTNGQSIIFASSTDEIKENPMFLYNKLFSLNIPAHRGVASETIINSDELHAYELYELNLNNDQFSRLTRSKKLDTNMSQHQRSNNHRLFTSVRSGNLEIYKYRPQVPNSPIRLTFSEFIDDEAEYSPKDNHFSWVRYGKQSRYSQILLGKNNSTKKITELTFGNQFHINPAWHPNGDSIYYSATSDDHKNFQLYVMKKDGSCKTRITNNKYKDFQPTIDPLLKNIVFTREINHKNQIFKTKLKEPQCTSS